MRVPSVHQDGIFHPANLSEPSKYCPRPAASQEAGQFKTLDSSANSKPVLSTGLRPQGCQEVRLYSNRVEVEKGLSQSSGFSGDLQCRLCMTVVSKIEHDL